MPHRAQHGSSWHTLLGHYKQQLLACDFFTVETAWPRTLDLFFFLELGIRRVHVAGCTTHPTSTWVTQQARQLCWTLQEEALPIRFLIHDLDTTFPVDFDVLGGIIHDYYREAA